MCMYGSGKRRSHEASRPVPPMDPLGHPSADWDTKLVYFGDPLEAAHGRVLLARLSIGLSIDDLCRPTS
jgi:hypothetical protein